jgi:anti-sigma factor RsiW
MDCAEYGEIVAADVDGLLTAAEQSAVDQHLAACARCQVVRRQQQTVKSVLHARAPRAAVPAPLRQSIVAALDEAQAATRIDAGARRTARIPRRARLILAGALAALLVLILRPLWHSSPPDLLAILAQDARAAEGQRVAFALRTSDVDELRRYYRSTGRIEFERSVDDFSAVGLRLMGGRVAQIGDVYTTFSVYEAAAWKVVCRRFRSGQLALPEGGERFGDTRVFTVDGVTICVIRLGDVICCLASSMPREIFLRQLAAASHQHL